MTEELYIIVSGKSHKLDLNSPSGITLKYVSNLFNDISKISCSHSYTFKLPKTANNCRVLDMAEDIRHNSTMVRKKLKAVFMQNGVSLFRNANLYIESIDNAYQAVFTWDVISGLQALKDNDISLRELSESKVCMYNNNGTHATSTDISEFDNSAQVLYPFYYAGVESKTPFGTAKRPSGRGDTLTSSEEHFCCGLPVVPVYHILELINSYYGTKFSLGKKFTYADWNDNFGNYEENGIPDIINRGCLPLVKWDMTETQKNNFSARIRSCMGGYKKWGSYSNMLIFKYYYAPSEGNVFSEHIATTLEGEDLMGVTVKQLVNLKIDGAIVLRYSAPVSDLKLKILKEIGGALSEIGTVDGICTINGKTINYSTVYEYHFEFRESLGYNSVSLDIQGIQQSFYIYFSAPASSGNITSAPFAEIYFKPEFTLSTKALYRSRSAIYSYMDNITNLPDISCMTFLKSLFYMSGAFPCVDSEGIITLATYDTLKHNLQNGKTLNWSKKLKNSKELSYETLNYNIGGFVQNNYFLMKNDDLDSKGSNDTDYYSSGKGRITVPNECLEYKKQIFQLPFYGAYIENLKTYWLKTGNTVKLWEVEGENKNAMESKPAFGVLCGKKWYNYISSGEYDYNGDEQFTKEEAGTFVLSLDIWQEFKNITKIPSYAYLQSILNNPIAIKENFLLNELDLRDLDYTVPIYLEKYNSYFAIITLERDSKGICKAELIKLPNT